MVDSKPRRVELAAVASVTREPSASGLLGNTVNYTNSDSTGLRPESIS